MFNKSKRKRSISRQGNQAREKKQLENDLHNLGLTKDDIDYVISQGKKLIEKPYILSNKSKISIETAKSALNLLKSSLSEPEKSLTREEILKIGECMKENPEYDTNDIAITFDIEEALVTKYLLSLPLTPIQKSKVAEMFQSNLSTSDIASMLKSSKEKVDEYIEKYFITFAGIEGNCILLIIQNNFGDISASKLRGLIVKKDLTLQDQLGCILRDKNGEEYMKLLEYFKKFEESRAFLQINMILTLEDILTIRQSDYADLEQLSVKLHKVQTVVRNYLEQYDPCLIEREHKMGIQITEMKQIVNTFGNTQLTFHTYRMIISDSLEELLQQSVWSSKQPQKAFKELLPQIFYYLKCSLPLEHLSNMIAFSYKGKFTTHDLFHLLFQFSDPVVKGFCLEHYSFSNPIPFIYPQLSNAGINIMQTTLCEELWYSLEDFNGLVSFGIGRASWNPVGKSYLLDLIFETDFVKGSPQNSAFHYSSIDIQLTKNLFGEMKDISSKESTKWAYIDCHGESNVDYINVICQHIDIALVHVTYQDFNKNREILETDIEKFTKHVQYIYLLIRDCPRTEEVQREVMEIADKGLKLVYIPNLTRGDVRIHSVKKSLKDIGYEILHLQPNKMVNSEFIEKVMFDLDFDGLKEILSNKELIDKIISYIHEATKSSKEVDFSFLSYYPHFVRDMSCYHKATFETDQKILDELNAERDEVEENYKCAKISDVVPYFNEITSKQHYTLIVWKLSKELTILSKIIINDSQNECIEQKNDKYTIEILWREALLSYIHTENTQNKEFSQAFPKNFSNHVESGEAFELIDGDNLRFFHKDINSLLLDLYKKQFEDLGEKKLPMKKQAPIVVSIFGPQSSGKSTLLNYCFGCKFLTSSGRCTRGIYASLSKLSRPVNHTEHFLILDTEGLDAIERGNIQDTSYIHFDRTMVLFCLSVSQVVIINVKGDIGSEMQNLLQICAYSLDKLKVSKVAVPKIFFVLNQQADPDQSKHIDTINLLIEKLNKDSNLIDTEGVKVSDLIQISRENLFVLPSAFNSEQINQPNAKLFESKVSKLTPTNTFAEKCTDLRIAIIKRLDDKPTNDIQPFETMEEWMDISGTVWDTLMKYQDIVKYRNVEEIICNKELKELVYELMKTHIHNEKENFDNTVDELINEINEMEIIDSQTSEKAIIFDQIFTKHRDVCLKNFSDHCKSKAKLMKVPHICEEHKSNLTRLIYIEGKTHSDKLKYQIDSLLTENKIAESIKNFQEEIVKNVDNYLEKTVAEQKALFENTWMKCFRDDNKEEDEKERNESFRILYSNFRMESISMESETSIFHAFQDLNFQMDHIILKFKSDIITRFQNTPRFGRSERFLYAFENNHSLKSMTPYPGYERFEYMGRETLYSKKESFWNRIGWKENFLGGRDIAISDLVPKECHTLVKYCSGYYDNVSIKWKGTSKNQQRLLLASQLRHPYNLRMSTWEKLIIDISTKVEDFIENDHKISQGTVRQIIAYLYRQFYIVNYEIDYIGAKLTNVAETMILTLVFAYAFQSFWKVKTEKRRENEQKKESKKEKLLEYFLQKIENRKMVRGEWNHQTMKESDEKMSKNFAHEFIESLKRGVKYTQQPIVHKKFKDRGEELSHESIFSSTNNTISEEIRDTPDHSQVDIDNFVVQYICNRNKLFTEEFNSNWDRIEGEIFCQTAKEMKRDFQDQLENTKMIINQLLHSFKHSCHKQEFDSENNFEISDINFYKNNPELLLKAKESPFKAMVMYLQMYLDPKVTSEEFNNTFRDTFKVDGIDMKTSKSYILCKKTETPIHNLHSDIFKKLSNTNMFNNENIFNILEYLTNFVEILDMYFYELTISEFSEMIENIQQEFEKNAIGCPFKCPGCGKLCERELHPNDGKCQIKTGHQICSMGGSIRYDDSEHTAVLKMCDDYKDDYPFVLDEVKTNWGQFREKCGSTWDWNLPTEEKYVSLQRHNRDKMIKIWNKFGEAILQCYGSDIKYVPYTSVDDVYKSDS